MPKERLMYRIICYLILMISLIQIPYDLVEFAFYRKEQNGYYGYGKNLTIRIYLLVFGQ